MPAIRQVTDNAKNHNLDNNDNFSPDGRFLCYDTREMVGPGIGNSQSIEMVEVATGAETVLFAPEKTLVASDEGRAAPGVGAVSFNPSAMEVAFIHGPPVDTVDVRGHYGKPNRQGARVPADGSQQRNWLDHRDVATNRDTLPGAHRGGTHRHEYCRDGGRIGFTYDDFLMPQYGRTIGYMVPRDDAPGNASHWFALLVPVAPRDRAKPGDMVMAAGDSWVDAAGSVRAFIGTTREDDGAFSDALYTVTIPDAVDITTADAGGPERFPSPPAGVQVRRLTKSWASGIVRGSFDGTRIAYYGRDDNGVVQVYVVPAEGGDDHPDPAMRPVQATHLRTDVLTGLRWHPDNKRVCYIANNAVMTTCVDPGGTFGKTECLTPQGDGPERFNLVLSYDGTRLAYNQAAPVYDHSGQRRTTYQGEDFLQVFVIGM
ncbi:MAG: DUF3748 domain-containing protein [Candidatus Hydrogenedentota bacterium]